MNTWVSGRTTSDRSPPTCAITSSVRWASLPRRVALLDGSAASAAVFAARCQTYERAIRTAGGLDLQIVGIGANGHLAFNEPGSQFESRTRVAPLAPSTRLANSAAFGSARRRPRVRPHPGLATIAEARTILLVAAGDEKADAVAAVFDGPIDPSCPASLLQRHRDVRAVLDPAAASGLSRRGRGFPTVLETHACTRPTSRRPSPAHRRRPRAGRRRAAEYSEHSTSGAPHRSGSPATRSTDIVAGCPAQVIDDISFVQEQVRTLRPAAARVAAPTSRSRRMPGVTPRPEAHPDPGAPAPTSPAAAIR